jgi:hypothetical protein
MERQRFDQLVEKQRDPEVDLGVGGTWRAAFRDPGTAPRDDLVAILRQEPVQLHATGYLRRGGNVGWNQRRGSLYVVHGSSGVPSTSLGHISTWFGYTESMR